MNVFTYYEPLHSTHMEVINVWADSWRKHGWTPIVIGENQFRLNYDWREYDAVVSKFPTVNDTRYDRACFRRWKAMSLIGGLMTDYDVANRGFTPEMLPTSDNLKILSKHHVPCLVWGTPSQYLAACSEFLKYQIRSDDLFEGKPLVEDMTILQKVQPCEWFDTISRCDVWNDPGWDTFPMVHCSSCSCGNRKLEIMRELTK